MTKLEQLKELFLSKPYGNRYTYILDECEDDSLDLGALSERLRKIHCGKQFADLVDSFSVGEEQLELNIDGFKTGKELLEMHPETQSLNLSSNPSLDTSALPTGKGFWNKLKGN